MSCYRRYADLCREECVFDFDDLLLRTVRLLQEDDEATRALCAKIACPEGSLTAAVERAFAGRLDGSCRTPMAGHAEITKEGVRFRAEILTPDGKLHCYKAWDLSLDGDSLDDRVLDALAKGAACAGQLLSEAEPEIRDVIAQG